MIREFIREEEDGSRTTICAIKVKGIFKTHNSKGPAIVNKEQKIKDYYLYGVKFDKKIWDKQRKFS